jgi:phosphatidate cytidylyltransferase
VGNEGESVSRRDDDGGQTTASGDGEDEGIPQEEDLSPEDEFREWVGETEQIAATEGAEAGKGWLGRMFGRSDEGDQTARQEEMPADEVGDHDQRLETDPGELSVFSAVSVDPEATLIQQGLPEEPLTEEPPDVGEEAASAEGAGDDIETEEASTPAADEGEPDPTFTELWGNGDEQDDDEVVDFEHFTSEDYLQSTTREYAGLAEAVARAEQEGTQPIAVSAEIPGLESGIVGLDDVVSATGGDPASDVIEPSTTSDLSIRVLTALGLLVLFAASLLSPFGIGALIVVVLGIAVGEMFAALIRSGYRPLSIFGFLGVAGAFFGTWASGPIAIPIALLLTAIAVFLFYATTPGRRAPLDNATLTILVTVWIGGLGGFAFDFLGSTHYRWLVLALVITVALMDVAQYFIGRRFGRHPLAPTVSPKKTVEGYVAGIVVAVGVGAAFGWAEPFDLTDGLVIGGVVAIVAPIGDLAVSVLKRALDVKDMGYILPGHGGVLDRVDAMVMAIPALWIAYSWMGLLT